MGFGERGGIAQLGEHLPCKQGVMSSNLIISTKSEARDQRPEAREEEKLRSEAEALASDIGYPASELHLENCIT